MANKSRNRYYTGKRRKKAKPKPKKVVPRQEPINVVEHFTMIALCSNRTFGETGIGRFIISNYTIHLTDDVVVRAQHVADEYCSAPSLAKG